MSVNVLNLPTAEQFQELIEVQKQGFDKSVQDYTKTPGNKKLLKGDTEAGFYGFVQPSEMGLIHSNPEGKKEYNGDNVCLALGLSAGTAMSKDVPLMKFHRKGKVLLVPMQPYRHTITWDAIYNAGLVFGTNDEGLLPPTGRLGTNLTINANDNSINCTNQWFQGNKTAEQAYADTVGVVGDTLVLKGWANAANNKTVTIVSITQTKIVVSGATLANETGGKSSRFYNQSKAVNQNKIITIGDNQYRVRLLSGAGDNPVDSYSDADRGAIGNNNDWNSLILPLHEHAKLQNWNYPAYAKDKNGNTIEDWEVRLDDENLRTYYTYGVGSYTWCKDVLNTETFRRVLRGRNGVSALGSGRSWDAFSDYAFRPCLESL